MSAIPVLNKTYVDNSSHQVSLSTTTSDVFDTKEFTVQADKAFNLTIQATYLPTSSAPADWTGVFPASSIQVNGIWYDLGNSGYTIGMALNKVRPDRYFDTKYIDLVGDNIVPSGDEYKIIVRLRMKMYAGSGYVNHPTTSINQIVGSGNRGVLIQEVADQNFVSIIIQEKDR